MCLPKAPKLPDQAAAMPAPLPTPQRLPTPAPISAPPPMAIPAVPQTPQPLAIAPTPEIDLKQTPPPVLAKATDDEPLIKKRKSKRAQLQQASKGTSALRIDRNTSIGTNTGGTGSTGLNIPK